MTQGFRNALHPGRRVQWFEIAAVLGQGGFGITYLARDLNLRQDVALKEYLPAELAMRDADGSVQPLTESHAQTYAWGLSRFLEEARTLAQFDHPNIVRVLTVFEAHNTAYMVMRYEQGESLAARLARAPALTEVEIRTLLRALLDGLERVHARGFIHRDIKPANIFLRADGSPVLLDFGSARQALGTETRTLTSVVSPGFAPFEQYASDGSRQGPWTDIYALGATFYRVLCGVVPLAAVDRSDAILHQGADALASATVLAQGRYSATLLRAVDRALAFKPQDRPQSVADWRALIDAPVNAADPGSTTRAAPETGSRTVVAADTLEEYRRALQSIRRARKRWAVRAAIGGAVFAAFGASKDAHPVAALIVGAPLCALLAAGIGAWLGGWWQRGARQTLEAIELAQLDGVHRRAHGHRRRARRYALIAGTGLGVLATLGAAKDAGKAANAIEIIAGTSLLAVLALGAVEIARRVFKSQRALQAAEQELRAQFAAPRTND